ncbi:MAG: toprim domain-containing protein [Acidobacterium ailaaui]|nr:toprim domain-containing protein [Pseudacidobacterium ailaaui]
MQTLSEEQKKLLAGATSRYHASLPGSPAAEYLDSRGLPLTDVGRFRLGYVAEPVLGHEMYRGRLAIPYLRRSAAGQWTVVSMKFRCVQGGCRCENHPKYLGLPDIRPRMYNTVALTEEPDEIGISEGEIDAITATVAGIPTVGIPGVEAWRPHFWQPFLGYASVYILADGDGPGRKFAHELAKQLPNAKIIPMPDGEDVNSVVRAEGREALMRRIGK